MADSVVEAVLEDVISRLVEENGIEVAVLDWGILEDIKETLEKSEDKPSP